MLRSCLRLYQAGQRLSLKRSSPCTLTQLVGTTVNSKSYICAPGPVNTHFLRESSYRLYSSAASTDDNDIVTTAQGRQGTVTVEDGHPVQGTLFDNPNDLYDSIKKASFDDINTVLDLVSLYKDDLYEDHVLESLNKVFVYSLNEKSKGNDVGEALTQDRRFQELCVALIRLGSYFEPSQIVNTVYKLKSFELGSKAVVMQVYLELAKNVVNSLTLVDIVHLADAIWKFETTNQVIILKEALRALAITKFDELRNVQQVDTLIKFVCYFGDMLSQMESARLMFLLEDEMSDMSFGYCLRLLSGMHNLVIQTSPVVNHCVQRIYKRATRKKPIDKQHVMTIFQAFANLNIKNNELTKILLKMVSESDEYKLSDLLRISNLLVDASYYNQPFFDELCTKLGKSNGEIYKMELPSMLRVLHNLSFVDYKNEMLSDIVNPIIEAIGENLNELDFSALFGSVFDLAVLGHFPKIILQKVLQAGNIAKLEGDVDMLDDWLVLREVVKQKGLANIVEPLDGRPSSVLTTWRFSRLQKCVLAEVSSFDNVVINVFTQEGMHIEYLLCMDEDDNYVPIYTSPHTELKHFQDSPPVHIESLNIPLHLKKLAIISFSRAGVVQNTGKLTGRSRLHVEALQNMGFLTIPVDRGYLFSLSERERHKFVNRRLRNPYSYQDLQWFGIGSF